MCIRFVATLHTLTWTYVKGHAVSPGAYLHSVESNRVRSKLPTTVTATQMQRGELTPENA